MNQRHDDRLDSSLNVRLWWLFAFALIVGPAIGLYRMSGSETAAETAAEASSRMVLEHVSGCWSVPEIRSWAMSAKHHKINPKFFMHSIQNAKIDPVEGECSYRLTLTSVDHSAQGAKVTWVETGRFVAGDTIPADVSLRLE